MARYISGDGGFKRVKVDKELSGWFDQTRTIVEELDLENTGETTKKIQQLTKALDDVRGRDSIDGNAQMLSNLDGAKRHLRRMVKAVHLKEKLLQDIAQITDCGYASLLLREYIPDMQTTIQKNSKATLMLRATFIKLTSIMNMPMVRLIQANADDYKGVCLYYCGELVKFVKEVLQVIPRRIFEVIEQIILVLSKNVNIKDMPAKIDQKDLRDYALFDQRAKIAMNASEIATHTHGV